MLKVLLIFLFISISGISVSQTLPWFFNTHTFRNWAKEKEVKTLLFINTYEQTTGSGGYTHQSYFDGDLQESVDLSGFFRKYTLDSLGFVESMSIMSIGITYPKIEESDDNTAHFKSVMIKMASEDYKPEKNIIKEYKGLGSTIYRFKSSFVNDTTKGGGEGVKSSNGIVYRESGGGFFDTDASIYYNYDIQLNQVISFDKNVPKQLISYNYRGDFYIPFVNKVSYNDSLGTLQFDGIFSVLDYEPSAVDTSFSLPYSRFHSQMPAVEYKNDTSLIKELLNNSETVNYYGFSGFNREYENRANSAVMVENYTTKTIIKRKTISYHSMRYREFLNSSGRLDSRGYPFEIYLMYPLHRIGLVENKNYGRNWSSFINLKTESTKYKNGKLKRIVHLYYNPETESWMPISNEKYDKKGHLLSLDIGGYYFADYISFLGERSDLGFIEQDEQLYNCTIEYDEYGNLSIKNGKGKLLVKTTQSELISFDLVHYNYGDCDKESKNSHYCPTHYLIIR